jgi:hypothetical protein
VIEQLIRGFELKTGHKVKAAFGLGSGTKQQTVRGDINTGKYAQHWTDITRRVTVSGSFTVAFRRNSPTHCSPISPGKGRQRITPRLAATIRFAEAARKPSAER